MGIKNALALLSATLLSLGTLSCSGEKVETSVLVSRAVEAGIKGDWSQARKISDKAVKQSPANSEALTMQALSLEHTGESDNALESASKAASIDPKNFMAQFTKGRLLYSKGRFNSCIAPLKAARNLSPDCLDATVLLAQASAIQNLPDAAGYYSILAKSDRFKNRPEPWNELGLIFVVRGEGRKAKQFLAQAERMAPNNPSVALNLAVVNELYLRNSADAAAYYKKYLRLTERNPELEPKRKLAKERLSSLGAR